MDSLREIYYFDFGMGRPVGTAAAAVVLAPESISRAEFPALPPI